MEKNVVDFGSSVEKALDRFVKDRENVELDSREVTGFKSIKRIIPVERLLPQLLPAAPISSNKLVEYLREAKLRVNVLGQQSSILDNEIRSASVDFWSTLDDVQNELKALDSDIQEEEIKAEDKFQQVHYNAFNRPIDTAARDIRQQVDPKTGLPFLLDQGLHLLPGAGLTLPVTSEERVFIRDIILLDEETDVGDTPVPLIKTDPRNLLDPDLAFRYVICRKVYDATGRLYNFTESTCRLLVQLGHIQLINHINIRPASHSPLLVKAIEYLNDSGEKITLDLDVLSLDGNLDILLEPIRTNNLYITLVQYAPVEQTEIITGDIRRTEINKALIGAGWEQTLDNSSETLKVKVYDFSLESLTIRLRTYKQAGFFTSQKIQLDKPLSFSLAVATETIKISSTQGTYGSTYFLPEGTVLYETYAHVFLEDQIHRHQIRTSFPIPSLKEVQTELMPIIGGESPTCFVPDFFYSAFKRRVKEATYAGNYVTVELEEAHGLTLGVVYADELELFVGRERPDYNFVSIEWEAITGTSLQLTRPTASAITGTVTENDTPRGWLMRGLSSEPFSVYKEETKLVLGTDYTYSIDDGVTWKDEILTLSEFAELKETLFAGSFRIKLVRPDYDRYYWCTYKRANTQYLHKNKLFLLKKNSVLVDKKLRSLKGAIQTMIILRADSRIPYLSSVIHNYKLKVRQL